MGRHRLVNPSLILFAKIAAFAIGLRSKFRRRHDEIGEVIREASESGVMRNIMIFAAIMIGLGTFMAQMADKMTPAPASATPSAKLAVVPDRPSDAALRTLSIPRDARGHFATEGRIDGQRVAFMVDTGASVIALNESSAARFGLRPSRSDYRATVSTANGTVKAAPTRLSRVEVGELIVRDVDAMVLPDEALSENLLGLSFLSKLKRFEYANGRMVLQQ